MPRRRHIAAVVPRELGRRAPGLATSGGGRSSEVPGRDAVVVRSARRIATGRSARAASPAAWQGARPRRPSVSGAAATPMSGSTDRYRPFRPSAFLLSLDSLAW